MRFTITIDTQRSHFDHPGTPSEAQEAVVRYCRRKFKHANRIDIVPCDSTGKITIKKNAKGVMKVRGLSARG